MPLRSPIAVALISTLLVVLSDSASAQLCVTSLRPFGDPDQAGGFPYGPIVASDGHLYGTTLYGGGHFNSGTIFRMDTNGFGYTVVHGFGASATEGRGPMSSVIEARNGALYGTTYSGGISNLGTIFMVHKDGSVYQVLHQFTGANGANPEAELLESSDGSLYGTTFAGGSNGKGTIFRIATNGANFQVIHNFGEIPNDGANPADSVIEASDGRLYTTTVNGGSANRGTIVGLETNGENYAVLFAFSINEGRSPSATVIEGNDGILYGTTTFGGASDYGTVFKIRKDGSGYSTMWHLGNVPGNLRNPQARFIEHSTGILYGTCSGSIFSVDRSAVPPTLSRLTGGGAGPLVEGSNGTLYGSGGNPGSIYRFTPQDNTISTLRELSITGGDGQFPSAPPIRGSDGLLYGVCGRGGTNGVGLIFRCDTNGNNYTVIRDGGSLGGVIEASDGRLYGATGSPNPFLGDIFRMGRNGSGYEVIYRFTNTPGAPAGRWPQGSLVEASDGFLYGTTMGGGFNEGGVIFRIDKAGTDYRVLYRFAAPLGGPDGARPNGGLIPGPGGMLYGTTSSGTPGIRGIVFAINRDGTGYTILKTFGWTSEGCPCSPLLLGSDGALYGTTSFAGASGADLNIFKLNANGSGYGVLASHPQATSATSPLVLGADGVIYGTAPFRNGAAYGAVYRINHNGSGFQVLRNFRTTDDPAGDNPASGLLRIGGTFYGMTSEGAHFGAGAIYRLTPTRTPQLSVATQSGTRGRLAVSGPAGCSCDIQYAENVANPVSWLNLTNVNLTAAPSTLVDTGATNAVRFYRAVLSP